MMSLTQRLRHFFELKIVFPIPESCEDSVIHTTKVKATTDISVPTKVGSGCARPSLQVQALFVLGKYRDIRCVFG